MQAIFRFVVDHTLWAVDDPVSDFNVAVGRSALFSLTTGFGSNTAIGYQTLYYNTTGYNNTAVGYHAGYQTATNAVITGNGNTFVGANAAPGTTTQISKSTAIGYNAFVNASNAMVLGGTGVDAVSVGIGVNTPLYTLHVNGSVAGTSAYQNLSDGRLKKDIEPIRGALDKIKALQGVTFTWNNRANPMLNTDDRNHLGFIAQDLEKILPQVVNTANDSMMTKTVEYGSIVPVLVEAIKDQQQLIESLKKNEKENAEKIKALEEALLRSKSANAELTNLKSELEMIKRSLGIEAKAND